MLTYIARRLLLTIPTVFIVTVIVFVMIRLVPGDAVDAMALRLSQQGMEIDLVREEIEAMLGLDVPVLTQYGRWIGILPNKDGVIDGLLQGNLGGSYWRAYTVNQEIARRLPSTLELGLLALIVSQIIALPIGIYSALRQDTIGDYIGRSIAITFIAVPSFWIATMVIIFPALWWGYMPPVMKKPFFEDPLRHLRAYIVPATVLGMSMSGLTMRMARTMMLEVLRQDYIRTAWAKGPAGTRGDRRPRPQERPDSGGDRRRTPASAADRRHRDHRDHLRAARHGVADRRLHHHARLPDAQRRHAVLRLRPDPHQHPGRPHLRLPGPEDSV